MSKAIQDLKAFYKRANFDPAFWARWMLGIRDGNGPGAHDLSPQVKEILDSVGELFRAKFYMQEGLEDLMQDKDLNVHLATLKKKVGVSTRAGQGTGKDTANSIIVHWAADCWPDTKVIVTAPKVEQAKTILWNEIRKWHDRRDPETGNPYNMLFNQTMDIQGETIKFRKGNGLAQIMTCPKDADPDQPATSMFGQHAEQMIVIVTEADGVPENVLTALTSTLTKPMNIAMLAFNPRRNSGFACRTHKDEKESAYWVKLAHNAEDCPDWMVSRESIQKKADLWGKESNYYRVFVKGEFPVSEESAIIPFEWVMAAVDREIEVPEDYPIATGVDPAGSGIDKNTLYQRQGGKFIMMREINKRKVGDALSEILEHITYEHEDKKFIDANGCGHFLYEQLRKEVRGVIAVMSQGEAKDSERFLNKRAEMWWNTREAFEKGMISIPNNERLIRGLTTPRWKEETLKIQVEKKSEIKKRLGHSPDEAEALVLTFAEGMTYTKFGDKKRKDGHDRHKKSKNSRGSYSFMGV
jgi:hypothetical protein